MLRVSNLEQYFGDQLLYEGVSFTVSAGEKIGVVGPNGSGKTTLLQTLAGISVGSKGAVSLSPRFSVGYVAQTMSQEIELLLREFIAPEFDLAKQRLSKVLYQLETRPNDACLLQIYEEAVCQFDAAGGFESEREIEKVVRELGLDALKTERSLKSLSGGQKTRAALAKILVRRADLLLLDEPTNNLDQQAIEWLESYICSSSSACVIVSHDRKFLDTTCTRILEIDPLSKRIESFSGNYSWYRERKRAERLRIERQFKEQQEKIKQLRNDVRDVKEQAHRTENTTVNDYLRGRSKKVAAKAKARESRLNRIIEREKVDKPRNLEVMRLSIEGRALHHSPLLRLESVGLQIENKQILSEINFDVIGSQRVLITGANGSGKSCLLKIIAREKQHSFGDLYVKDGISICYLPQHQESLPENVSMLEFFQTLGGQQMSEGSWRTFLDRFQFSKNDVFKKIHSLSQGEKAKVLLASCMLRNLDLLIMDEPTNHLDLETIESLECALELFKGALISDS